MTRVFTVTEIHRYKVIGCDNKLDAISARERGEGEPINEPVTRYAFSESVGEENWPVWARELKTKCISRDTGIGDIAAREIGPEKSEAFKDWIKKMFGKSCSGGCISRLNRMYPLK